MTVPAVRDQIDRDFWLEGFRDYLALEAGHSPNTVEAYLRDLRRMGEFALSRGVRDPGRVGRPLLRDFVYLLKDLGLSAATIRRGVSAIRTYYGFLVGEGRVEEDPSDRLETPRRGRTLPDTLTVREVEALLAAPSIDDPLGWRDRALLELAYGAGLRVSEVCGLEVRDLLLAEGLDPGVQTDVRLGLLSPPAAIAVAVLPRGNTRQAADVVMAGHDDATSGSAGE